MTSYLKTVCVNQEDWEALQEIARAQGISTSKLLRRLIRRYLREHEAGGR